MVSNQPLKRPPLQEAVFEIRFPDVEDYAILAGGMAVAHKNDFPIVEKLQYADLPNFVQIMGVVKHRFFDKERGTLFQTGLGVLSVNSIKYEGFKSFIDNINNVILSAQNFGVNIKNPTRISIRYINKFNDVTNPFVTLNFQQPFANKDFDRTRFIQIREVEDVNSTTLVSTNFEFPVDGNNLILDIDAFCESPSDEWNTEMILEWIKKAHDDIIFNKFISLVSKSEMESRK